MAVAREDYESQNNALMQDMPTLYDGRMNYIEPSFKALVQAQVQLAFVVINNARYGSL